MKLTLDWNCVIAVEEKHPQATCVLELVDWHRKGEFEVALLAASASENNRSKRFPGSAKSFTERVERLGWRELPLVPMPAVTSLTYIDYSYQVADGEKFKNDLQALWEVIAPRINQRPKDHLPTGTKLTDDAIQSDQLSKWRNAWCDVISAYSHIHEGRDIFVTNNIKDFQHNAKRLLQLGMRCIATPKGALAAARKLGSSQSH